MNVNEDDDNGAKKQTTLIPQEVGILCNKTPVPSILIDLRPVLEKDKWGISSVTKKANKCLQNKNIT